MGPCDGHCGQPADGHEHLSMPDPPGTTRLAIITQRLDGSTPAKPPWCAKPVPKFWTVGAKAPGRRFPIYHQFWAFDEDDARARARRNLADHMEIVDVRQIHR